MFFYCSYKRRSILDIFLAVIAKILSIQVKTKNNGNGKGVKTVTIMDHFQPSNEDPHRWYLKGTVTRELASEIDSLLKDMSSVRTILYLHLILSVFPIQLFILFCCFFF